MMYATDGTDNAVPGLTFDDTATVRVLSGTPTTAATTALTYTVTDERGSTASDTFPITVAAGVALNAPNDQTYTMGQTITALTLPAATGGTGTLTYTLTGTGSDAALSVAVPGLTFTTRHHSRPVRYADHGGDHGPDLHRHRRQRQHRLGYLDHHRGNRKWR